MVGLTVVMFMAVAQSGKSDSSNSWGKWRLPEIFAGDDLWMNLAYSRSFSAKALRTDGLSFNMSTVSVMADLGFSATASDAATAVSVVELADLGFSAMVSDAAIALATSSKAGSVKTYACVS